MDKKYEKIATVSDLPEGGITVDTSLGEMKWEYQYGWVKNGVIWNEAPPEFWYREIQETTPAVEEVRFPETVAEVKEYERTGVLPSEQKEINVDSKTGNIKAMFSTLRLELEAGSLGYNVSCKLEEAFLKSLQSNTGGRLGEGFVKKVLARYTKEEISFGKMVELLNEQIQSLNKVKSAGYSLEDLEVAVAIANGSTALPEGCPTNSIENIIRFINKNKSR